ncbi:hypothetical protein [Alkalicoccobacillus porphyridii]|uniref:Bacterial Pleckstrin homology domain-containing protein n=1 Tax=Alkalicoccobacillus porphyridii TaxID=2597270 RepID=A0A553ZW25_9BACI|nr:hypothetical protein [Alkalicoccobacillus porphyridii]TSB45680.1 hypothetical protein FN960_14420 [Alkalicoccobacillus porphyridii]
MEPLATHRCIEVKQEIGWIEKRTVETSFDLHLFEDRIEVKDTHYPIKTVLDISYRLEKDKIGFLYLHTTGGIRTYFIKQDPSKLIEEFKVLMPSTKHRM